MKKNTIAAGLKICAFACAIAGTLAAFAPLPPAAETPVWGFFAHRRINRLAALTLPPEMMVFFKKNIDFVSDHAVDPDMRRYATNFEAPRHYIDLDQYGAFPFDSLPRTWTEALMAHTRIWGVNGQKDTLLLYDAGKNIDPAAQKQWKRYFNNQVLPLFTADSKNLPLDSLETLTGRLLAGKGISLKAAFFKETLSEHGILPWHLQKMQRDLTEAFRRKDANRILRLCADMGHYIGDAHVPLHTCSNYNGQKTGQDGIHGFWESRIPELFADASYDYLVGKPDYIRQPAPYFWDIVFASHLAVDSVLSFEKELRRTFPADRQMCPDMRNGMSIVAPCRDFSEAYQQALDGMIERRMRDAIHAVASAWYTAWVDAGQPNLSKMDMPIASESDKTEEEHIRKTFESGKIIGRPEDH